MLCFHFCRWDKYSDKKQHGRKGLIRYIVSGSEAPSHIKPTVKSREETYLLIRSLYTARFLHSPRVQHLAHAWSGEAHSGLCLPTPIQTKAIQQRRVHSLDLTHSASLPTWFKIAANWCLKPKSTNGIYKLPVTPGFPQHFLSGPAWCGVARKLSLALPSYREQTLSSASTQTERDRI